MIIDTSAIVAILQDEPEAPTFAALIESTSRVHISAATVLEASIVLGRARQQVLDDFLLAAAVRVEPVDETQLHIARRAYLQFGRSSGSPAKLNYGDCFSYALAAALAQPLLFKGNDFGHTDVQPAAQ